MSQDFSKGKIYKITNDYNDDVYVGSTCDTLVKRFSAHKCQINSPEKMNRPLYALMKEIGFDRFRIELIEDYPCEDKYQLRQREGYFIREIGTLNIKIENRTQKEWKQEWNEKNKEHIKEYCKLYRDDHQENILKYREEHKDKQKDYCKEYYQQRAEKLNEKVQCECGYIVSFQHLNNHKKTKRHFNLLNQQLTI